MTGAKGLTLIELMVVVLIVSILSAAAVPLMRGRVDAAKWSEAKPIMSNIATGLRTHVAKEGSNFTDVPTLTQLGLVDSDLDGTYFEGSGSGTGDFSWVINDYDPIDFLITATAPAGVRFPSEITLDHAGRFTEN